MKQVHFQKEIFIPSTNDGLNTCLEFVYELSTCNNLNVDTAFSLHTVIIEAVENAIMHGNKFDRDLKVRILVILYSREIFVEVEDCGNGFDIESIPSPIEGSAILKESGRGVFFIKQLSTNCKTVGRGNILQIKLKR